MSTLINATATTRKIFDLEERTFLFADRVRKFAEKLPRKSLSYDDKQQLLNAAGSVAANYIEANEAIGKGDFHMRIRICRKESKESRLWLRLAKEMPEELQAEYEFLLSEAHQFVRIFSTILKNSLQKHKQA